MSDQWLPAERTVKAILDAYLHPDDPASARAVTASTGKQAASAAGAPAGDADSAASAPPAPAPSGAPSAAHAPAQKTRIPRWDGPDYLALPNPEDLSLTLPAKGQAQDRTKDELTDKESKALQIEDAFQANSHFTLMFGYKSPWVTRLDPKIDKVVELVRIIKEVRSRIVKVPITGLTSAEPTDPASTTGSFDGAPTPVGAANPRITLQHWNDFQVVFNVQYNGAKHDVTTKAQWTVDDDKIAKVVAGKITSKGTDGSTTVTGTWKSVVCKIDVVVDVKAKQPSRSTAKPATGQTAQAGALNWMPYPPAGRAGWIYDDDPGPMPPAFFGQLDRFAEAVSKTPKDQWFIATILRKLAQEGSCSSVNTYDGMVLTLGSGNASDNALAVLAEASEKSPEVRRLLYFCGFAVEEQKSLAQGTGQAPHVVKMVDLSDESNPRIICWDRHFHFYGWANRLRGKGGKGLIEPIKPLTPASKALTFPDPSYDPDKVVLTWNSAAPYPHTVFAHWTPRKKPADDSFGLSKNNIEILHAIIALHGSSDPPTGKVFFDHDWIRSQGHVGHGIPASDATNAGTITIGLRSAFIAIGLIAHNWGYGSRVAGFTPAGAKRVPSFVERYLHPDEISAVKTDPAADPNRNALVFKSCARALAVTLEQNRLSNAIGRFLSKRTPIDFETIEGMLGSGWWGYGRLVHYWKEMVTGKSVNDESIVARLKRFKSSLDPARLKALLDPYGLTEKQLDDAIADAGLVTLTGKESVFADGFSMTPKTDGKFDFNKLYAKDYVDGTKATGKNPNVTKNGDPAVGYSGDGNAYFCVGPKDRMPDLPSLVKLYDRGFQLVGVDDKQGVKRYFPVWKITGPTNANTGKFVVTNQLGEFVDESYVVLKDQTSPRVLDSAPAPK